MNKGLSHNFALKNGGFQLTEGSGKVKDCFQFFMFFDHTVRIYYDDYQPKLLWLIQKPGSQIDTYKTLILGRLKKVLTRYVFNMQLTTVDLKQLRASGEKTLEINIEYVYTGKQAIEDNATIFI